MRRLPIADCRLPIGRPSAVGCLAGGGLGQQFEAEDRFRRGLPIADCRLPIGRSSAARSLSRGGHDGRQGVCFLQQRGQFPGGHDAGLNQQFEPQCGFVGLFFNRANFGDEFRPASRTARGAIVRGHRGSTAHDLLGDGPGGVVFFGYSLGELDNTQSERFGSVLQFNRVHGPTLRLQLAIGNRQSAI